MFNTNTVFILGAGASWHYGYPTGEDLVKKVIQRAQYASLYFQHSMETSNSIIPEYVKSRAVQGAPVKQQWQSAWEECKLLEAGLVQVNPLVIDYYLGWNPRLREIGTLLITWVILECEWERKRRGGNVNRLELLHNSPIESDRASAGNCNIKNFKDDWCRFVIYQLAINCRASSDLLKNLVEFVTFNYDVSLELAIYHGLRHIQQFDDADVQTFLGNDRILHIYGKVRTDLMNSIPELHWGDQSKTPRELDSQTLQNNKAFYDWLFDASKALRVIDPVDKGTDEDVIQKAVAAISKAKFVYILGYGFDENNSARLGLANSFHYEKSNKSVFFTNFRNINRVNKKASKVIYGIASQFESTGPSIQRSNNAYYERSTRDVYEALELDFEMPD